MAAMLTTTGAAIETSAGTAAIEARAAFAGAAIFDGAGFGGTAAAAGIGAAIFAAAIVVTAIIVTSITTRAAVAASVTTTITAGAAVTASAAEGTLETGTRIAAADAGGIAGEVFTRSACGTGRPGFAGEENGVFLDEGRGFDYGNVAGAGAGGVG